MSLPPLEVGPRADRVRARLERAGAEALLVTSLTNVRWLTGFTGSAGRALVLPDELVLVTDGRYGERAAQELAAAGAEARVTIGRTSAEQAEALAAASAGIGRLGLEAEHVTWAALDRYRTELAAALVATTGLVEAERRTKDRGEVARIERAGAIASQALADVIAELDAEPEEREFALTLDDRMRALGAEDPSFPSIVASGPNAAKPHHAPSERRIREGDSLILDFGALYDGYHSDMTRTALLGDVDPWLRDAYAAVEAAQAEGRGRGRRGRAGAGPRPGVPRPPERRRLRRALHPWHGPRGRPSHPRGSLGHVRVRRHAAGRRCRHGRARRLSFLPRRHPDRGHGPGHERRLPAPHAHPEGSVMPAISTNDLKNGITLNLDNGLYTVVEFQHVKPGKGGAFVRTKLKNVRNGAVLERTFNAGVRVEQAIVDKRDMQFLYREGDDYVFMDGVSYEQIHVPKSALGDAADYLVEQMSANLATFEGEIIQVEIPASVELNDRRDRAGRPG